MKDQRTRRITVALAGNPNSGKTSLFNSLTGARQHVGNWPGVTVERKEGSLQHGGYRVEVVDLPGTYSLTAYSPEEMIVRDYILSRKPDVVINIVDASNLERNLYLTAQLLELGAKLVVALNMVDVAEQRGLHVDAEALSELLGCPVVPTVASRGRGTEEVVEAAIKAATGEIPVRGKRVDYGRELESHIRELVKLVPEGAVVAAGYDPRWVVLKLLEGDEGVAAKVREMSRDGVKLMEELDRVRSHLVSIYGDDLETVIVDRRYGFASGAAREVISKSGGARVAFSDRLDRVLTHRVLGFVIFGALMYATFWITFTLGSYPTEWIDQFFGWLGEGVGGLVASPVWLRSLLVDGIIGGVGAVLVFLPYIFLLFLAISILEDTGYMARAAFIMDKVMHKLGLHGKAFIPMLMGFGCNVPAIMATRTLENRRDRLITILVNPLMSCSARLPVYTLLVGVFFARRGGLVIFSLYFLGIVLAVAMAKLFGRFLLPGESAPFVMELPPYRIPTLKGIMVHMWERGGMFLKKAGTVIFLGSVAVWALGSLPWGVEYGSADSLAGGLGRFAEPIFRPLGFNWVLVVALIFGFVAKEIVVSSLAVLHGVEEGSLASALRGTMSPAGAYAFMAFTLIYTPCLATVAVIKKETGSWRWTAFAVGYSVVLAYVVALLIYQLGSLL